MVGNLHDPGDSRVHFARDNRTDMGRPPILTRCDRSPAADSTYDVGGPVDCAECLTLVLLEQVWAAMVQRRADQLPKPARAMIGTNVYEALLVSRTWRKLHDGSAGITPPPPALFSVPLYEAVDGEAPGDGWELRDDDGEPVASGVLR